MAARMVGGVARRAFNILLIAGVMVMIRGAGVAALLVNRVHLRFTVA